MDGATARLLRRYGRERFGAAFTKAHYRTLKRDYNACTAKERRDIKKFVERFHQYAVAAGRSPQ